MGKKCHHDVYSKAREEKRVCGGPGAGANEHKSSDGREGEITEKKTQQKVDGNCCCINIKTISVSVTFMKFYELYR